MRASQKSTSHFLGDHLARFQATPSAGVHVSNDIDNPYKHTPANQGATGTNYGSYGEGHYNLTTEASANSSTWKHRTYQGTLRGHVVEMRMNPIYTSPIYKITDTAGATGDLSLGGTFTAGSATSPTTPPPPAANPPRERVLAARSRARGRLARRVKSEPVRVRPLGK